MKMESSDSFLTDDKFESETKLYQQNTVDGAQLVDTNIPRYLENHIFVATPNMGEIKLSCVKSLLEFQSLCLSKDMRPQFHMVRSSIIITGRNMCVQAFLKSRCSHMLFIDSDIEFDPSSILVMLRSNKDIVLTPYPMKAVNWDKAREMAAKSGRAIEDCPYYYCMEFPDKNNIESKDGLVEIKKGPAGCMLIKREVFEQMSKAYPKMKIKQKHLVNGIMGGSEEMWNFFDTSFNEDTGEFIGEDYAFCNRWTAIGGKIYANVDSYITHHGDYAYRGRFIDEGRKIK
jgi:hypothetical protein